MIVLEGMQRVLAGVDGARVRAMASLPGILYRLGEKIMTEAKRQTPVDTGNLRASGHVLPPSWSGDALEVVLGFGGPAGAGNVAGDANREHVGYAVAVHENLAAAHRVGKAKYLEDPLMDAAARASEEMGNELRRELERGG